MDGHPPSPKVLGRGLGFQRVPWPGGEQPGARAAAGDPGGGSAGLQVTRPAGELAQVRERRAGGDRPACSRQPARGCRPGVRSRPTHGPSPSPEPHQEEAVPVQIRGPRDADELGPRAQSGAGARAGGRGPHGGQGLRGGECPAGCTQVPIPSRRLAHRRFSPAQDGRQAGLWAQGHLGVGWGGAFQSIARSWQ